MKRARNPQWLSDVGRRLELTREALDMRQVEMAAAFELSSQAWNHYEKGRRPLDIELAITICNRYGATLDWLYRGRLDGLRKDLADRIERKMAGLSIVAG